MLRAKNSLVALPLRRENTHTRRGEPDKGFKPLVWVFVIPTRVGVNRHSKALLQAVQRGLHARPIHRPRNVRPDERFLARIEALKQWRKLKARELEVESDIILPRDLLHSLASTNPLEKEALTECLQEVPWRRGRYGGGILKVLR